jgi:hypothetical protein
VAAHRDGYLDLLGRLTSVHRWTAVSFGADDAWMPAVNQHYGGTAEGGIRVLTVLLIAGLVLLDVGIVAARRSRNRFIRADDAFPCRFRAGSCLSVIWPSLARHCTRRWSRPMWAKWVDDVLIVRRGPLLPRTISARAQVCWAGVYSVSPDEHEGFGRRPVAVTLRLSDDSVVEVVTAGYGRLALVGPYLAAAINDLPDTRFRHTGFDVRARQPDDHDERWH